MKSWVTCWGSSLYLKVSNFFQFFPGLDDAIHHHKSTLRGLVFHERRLMAINSERTVKQLLMMWK